MNKTIIPLLLLSLLLVVSCSTPTKEEIISINLRDHKDLAMHIHPSLSIVIKGTVIPIPDGIGISPAGLRVIHTHGSDGRLHLESPYETEFLLEDFFTIWGKRFDEQCILDACVDERHTLTVKVNGQVDTRYGKIPLRNHDTIIIEYTPIQNQN